MIIFSRFLSLVHFMWNCPVMDANNFESTLVQVMDWCHQVASHYLNQCWPRSVLPYGITGPQSFYSLKVNCFLTNTYIRGMMETLRLLVGVLLSGRVLLIGTVGWFVDMSAAITIWWYIYNYTYTYLQALYYGLNCAMQFEMINY